MNSWLERFEIINTSYKVLYESGTENFYINFKELPKQAKKVCQIGRNESHETQGTFYRHRTTTYYNYT